MQWDQLTQIPEIRHVMTPFPHWIDIEAPIREAQQMMAVHAIRHLPVMEGGQLVGVVADRDIRLVLDPREGKPATSDMTVREVYAGEAYIVDTHERLDTVLLHMSQRSVSAALVVMEGRLAGIFTVTDVCRTFGLLLRHRFPPLDGTDAA
jgi:acetoin utilization protein AcuB